jgi:hypothetical protein
MKTFIAQSTLGLCGICQLLLDAGEWVGVRPNGRQIHLGCVSRIPATTNEDQKPDQSQPQFSLFGDNELETVIEAKNETVERAKEILGIKHFSFDGATALGVDLPRLAGQLARVFNLMRDEKYRNLTEIAALTGCLETSASARLRDLRKLKFGGHAVDARRAENEPGLIWEYRLTVNANTEKESDEQRNAA